MTPPANGNGLFSKQTAVITVAVGVITGGGGLITSNRVEDGFDKIRVDREQMARELRVERDQLARDVRAQFEAAIRDQRTQFNETFDDIRAQTKDQLDEIKRRLDRMETLQRGLAPRE